MSNTDRWIVASVTKPADEMVTELIRLGMSADDAVGDVAVIAEHVRCAGHTVFLPRGRTALLSATGDGRMLTVSGHSR